MVVVPPVLLMVCTCASNIDNDILHWLLLLLATLSFSFFVSANHQPEQQLPNIGVRAGPNSAAAAGELVLYSTGTLCYNLANFRSLCRTLRRHYDYDHDDVATATAPAVAAAAAKREATNRWLAIFSGEWKCCFVYQCHRCQDPFLTPARLLLLLA